MIGVGSVVNGYVFEQEIGRGGYSTVYLVHKENINQSNKFAAKVMTCNSDNINKSWDSFDAEVTALMKLDHPNIVKLYDKFHIQNQFVIILEYCERSVQKEMRIEDNQRLMQLSSQLISAVAYAHSAKIAHLDIKPPNVLLNRFGHVVLADFGISKIGTGIKFSAEHGFACTLAYSPPEVVDFGKHLKDVIDPFKIDSWAVGMTILEMATGSLPFSTSIKSEIKNEIRVANFYIPPSMPPYLRSLVKRCFAYNPASRASMIQAEAEILKELQIFGSQSFALNKLNGSLAKFNLNCSQPTFALGQQEMVKNPIKYNKNRRNCPSNMVKKPIISKLFNAGKLLSMPIARSNDRF